MKKLLFSLLLIACVKVAGQDAFSLKNKAYSLTDLKGKTEECAQKKILFISDSSFLAITKCKEVETLGSGRYIVNKKGITLNFENTVVVKNMDPKLGYILYTDSLVPLKTLALKAVTKKKKLHFKNGSLYMAPTEGLLGTLLNLEADNRLVRLGMAKDSNIDIFEGTDFSSKYDSIIIQRGVDKLNGEEALAWFNDENKLLRANNGGYSEGRVHHAPDSKFKMFVFEGEACGAHCGTVFTTLVQLPSGKVHEMWTSKIQSLQKYDEEKYAVISHSWGGGTTGGHVLVLTLFSVDEEGVTYLDMTPGNGDEDFDIYTPWWGFDHLKMDYDPATQKVTYSYLSSPMDTETLMEYLPERTTGLADNEGLLVSGTLVLEDGIIIESDEEYMIVEQE